MEAPPIEKEKRAATVTLILGVLGLVRSPFPLILLQNNFIATTLLKAGADYPILNIPFCSSIFLSIFAVVNGLGYLLNNSYQAGKKAWYLALLGTGFGLVNLLLGFVVWLFITRFAD
jgi:hypothetical protein